MRMWLAPSAFFPARGGVEELTHQLAKEYMRRGHEVTVVVHRNPMELPATRRSTAYQWSVFFLTCLAPLRAGCSGTQSLSLASLESWNGLGLDPISSTSSAPPTR